MLRLWFLSGVRCNKRFKVVDFESGVFHAVSIYHFDFVCCCRSRLGRDLSDVYHAVSCFWLSCGAHAQKFDDSGQSFVRLRRGFNVSCFVELHCHRDAHRVALFVFRHDHEVRVDRCARAVKRIVI